MKSTRLKKLKIMLQAVALLIILAFGLNLVMAATNSQLTTPIGSLPVGISFANNWNGVTPPLGSPQLLQAINETVANPLYPPVVVNGSFRATGMKTDLGSKFESQVQAGYANPTSQGWLLAQTAAAEYSPRQMESLAWDQLGPSGTGFSSFSDFQAKVESDTTYAAQIANEVHFGWTHTCGSNEGGSCAGAQGQTLFFCACSFWTPRTVAYEAVEFGAANGYTMSDTFNTLTSQYGYSPTMAYDAILAANTQTSTLWNTNRGSSLDPTIYGQNPVVIGLGWTQGSEILGPNGFWIGAAPGVNTFQGAKPQDVANCVNSGICDNPTVSFMASVEQNGGLTAIVGGHQQYVAIPEAVVRQVGASMCGCDASSAQALQAGSNDLAAMDGIMAVLTQGYVISNDGSSGGGCQTRGCISVSAWDGFWNNYPALVKAVNQWQQSTGLTLTMGGGAYETGLNPSLEATRPTTTDNFINAILQGWISPDLAKSLGSVPTSQTYDPMNDPVFQNTETQSDLIGQLQYFAGYGWLYAVPVTAVTGSASNGEVACSGGWCFPTSIYNLLERAVTAGILTQPQLTAIIQHELAVRSSSFTDTSGSDGLVGAVDSQRQVYGPGGWATNPNIKWNVPGACVSQCGIGATGASAQSEWNAMTGLDGNGGWTQDQFRTWFYGSFATTNIPANPTSGGTYGAAGNGDILGSLLATYSMGNEQLSLGDLLAHLSAQGWTTFQQDIQQCKSSQSCTQGVIQTWIKNGGNNPTSNPPTNPTVPTGQFSDPKQPLNLPGGAASVASNFNFNPSNPQPRNTAGGQQCYSLISFCLAAPSSSTSSNPNQNPALHIPGYTILPVASIDSFGTAFGDLSYAPNPPGPQLPLLQTISHGFAVAPTQFSLSFSWLSPLTISIYPVLIASSWTLGLLFAAIILIGTIFASRFRKLLSRKRRG